MIKSPLCPANRPPFVLLSSFTVHSLFLVDAAFTRFCTLSGITTVHPRRDLNNACQQLQPTRLVNELSNADSAAAYLTPDLTEKRNAPIDLPQPAALLLHRHVDFQGDYSRAVSSANRPLFHAELANASLAWGKLGRHIEISSIALASAAFTSSLPLMKSHEKQTFRWISKTSNIQSRFQTAPAKQYAFQPHRAGGRKRDLDISSTSVSAGATFLPNSRRHRACLVPFSNRIGRSIAHSLPTTSCSLSYPLRHLFQENSKGYIRSPADMTSPCNPQGHTRYSSLAFQKIHPMTLHLYHGQCMQLRRHLCLGPSMLLSHQLSHTRNWKAFLPGSDPGHSCPAQSPRMPHDARPGPTLSQPHAKNMPTHIDHPVYNSWDWHPEHAASCSENVCILSLVTQDCNIENRYSFCALRTLSFPSIFLGSSCYPRFLHFRVSKVYGPRKLGGHLTSWSPRKKSLHSEYSPVIGYIKPALCPADTLFLSRSQIATLHFPGLNRILPQHSIEANPSRDCGHLSSTYTNELGFLLIFCLLFSYFCILAGTLRIRNRLKTCAEHEWMCRYTDSLQNLRTRFFINLTKFWELRLPFQSTFTSRSSLPMTLFVDNVLLLSLTLMPLTGLVYISSVIVLNTYCPLFILDAFTKIHFHHPLLRARTQCQLTTGHRQDIESGPGLAIVSQAPLKETAIFNKGL
ncbi:uncharacterized protein BDR25DRAFT_353905 [Lindgomyces ingoldianus]|uniref:Uncharacterized protein n=1 Tax=Lindgomyces ingoldianus TaxID=673940 RepID=A0ACB6QZ65_9PLEO|nr:uncharacterized protein BDR25DRAFT_353905 [Lindgomyces ingoldianus]KAF2472196.1 hypothetical protein BDR25DRAFT_353905 [Lindgomyces ingoldianus]